MMAAFTLLLALATAPQADLVAAHRQQAAAEARATALDTAAAQAETRADRLIADAAALAARVQASEAGLAAARLRLDAVERQRRAIALRIANKRAPLARLLAAQARIARRPMAVALVEQDSLADTGHIRALLAAIQPAIAARTATMRDDLAAADRLRGEAALAVATIEGERRALSRRRSALAAAEAGLHRAALAYRGDAETSRAEALGLAERAETLETLVARAGREAAANARLAALPAPLERPLRAGDPVRPAALPAPAGPPIYRLPADGRVVAGSGEAGANGFRHRGLTLATTPGAQAVAPAAGRIVYAGAFRDYGGVVIVDHGNGWTSLIAGLTPVTATTGALLIGGSPIGRTGATLIVELRHDGRPVDITRMAQTAG